jgi:hypothetical protein
MRPQFMILLLVVLGIVLLLPLFTYEGGPFVHNVVISETSTWDINATPDTMTFNETAVIRNNRPGPTKNLYLHLQVYDKENGQVILENTRNLPPVAPNSSGAVSQFVTIPRERSFRFVYSLYENGRIIAQSEHSMRVPTGDIPPFERTDGPVVSGYGYRYAPPMFGEVVLNVNVTLKNNNRSASAPAILVIRELNEETRETVDQKTIPVPEIPPGETRDFSVTLAVPGKQDYLLQFFVERDGIVVAKDDTDFWIKPGFFRDNATQMVM